MSEPHDDFLTDDAAAFFPTPAETFPGDAEFLTGRKITGPAESTSEVRLDRCEAGIINPKTGNYIAEQMRMCRWWRCPGWRGYATGCGGGPCDVPEDNKCPICKKEIDVAK